MVKKWETTPREAELFSLLENGKHVREGFFFLLVFVFFVSVCGRIGEIERGDAETLVSHFCSGVSHFGIFEFRLTQN